MGGDDNTTGIEGRLHMAVKLTADPSLLEGACLHPRLDHHSRFLKAIKSQNFYRFQKSGSIRRVMA